MQLSRCIVFATIVAAVSGNESLIFPPPDGKDDLPVKMMVLIPGANVATEYYESPVQAIQEAAELQLWAIVPAIPGEKCIQFCTSTALCSPLNYIVSGVMDQAIAMGYNGSTSSDVFIAGHSLGGVCAGTYAQAYIDDPFAGVIVMGAYVSDSDVATYPLPVLTLGAELDGGLGRPGYISKSLVSSDAWAQTEGESVNSAWQMENGPVIILPGLDHSSFCPGFAVPGDVFPAEASNETALALISAAASSFLHLHTTQSEAVQSTSVANLQDASVWTRDLLSPLFSAFSIEVSTEHSLSPWCSAAQHELAQLSSSDDEHLTVQTVYEDDSGDFEHTRVTYVTSEEEEGNLMTVNVSGHNEYYDSFTDFASTCVTAAKEIGCKLASADRIYEQLNKTSTSPIQTCRDVNALAITTAEQLLSQSEAGQGTLARFQEKGRPLCLLEDKDVFLNIGPLFISETLSLNDNGTCLEVQSVTLGPVALDSSLFPGVHYCKFLSPARVIDYMMIDSLKEESGCLNT